MSHRPRIPLNKFLPQTFRIDLSSEFEKFVSAYQDGEYKWREGLGLYSDSFTGKELWICKPTGANQGKGIFLVRDLQQVYVRLEQDQKSHKPTSKPVARIVQRYYHQSDMCYITFNINDVDTYPIHYYYMVESLIFECTCYWCGESNGWCFLEKVM